MPTPVPAPTALAMAAAARQNAVASGRGNIASMVTGGLSSPVAGRTDHLPISVPPGAYVIPADIVSHLGQGNTAAGTKILDRMFPHAPAPPGQPGGVDIMAAGGEYVVPPQAVAAIGHGDPKVGHEILDSFVKHQRAEAIKHLRALPGPITDGHR